ncbi:MAG: GEVED domain-containing protein, partial [Bacteroidales bacterium]|nr:GEVED domain-containing protein [Bacteroidales bacterium]
MVNLGSTYPFKLKVGTCDQENSRIVKIFADWNSNGIFDENELIITSDVINSTSDFEGMITIPTSVKPGFKGRLRIIVSETTNPDEISSCGIYNAGETQDYLLKFDYPLFDIGVSKLKYPSKEIMCSSDNEWVKMEVKNYGSTPLSGINFTAEVYENFNLIETYHNTHLGIITPSQSKIFQFDAGFKTSPSKNYSIICIVNVENDLNPSNDTLQFNFITAPLSEAPQGSAILCDGTDEIRLEAVSSGTAFWYD